MPYIVNRKGLKVRYSPTKISEKITQIYNYLYNDKSTVYYRSEIILLTDNIIKKIKSRYGEEDSAKWEIEGIEEAIIEELKAHKNPDVLKSYLLIFPPVKKKEIVTFTPEEIADSSSRNTFLHQAFEIDPVWSVQIENNEVQVFEEEEVLDDFGVTIRSNTFKKPKEKKIAKKHFLEKKRSEWFAWFRTISKETNYDINLSLLEKVAAVEDKSYSFDSSGWYSFWQDVIFEAMKYDPRLFALLRLIQYKKNLSHLIGKDWLDGSGLNQKESENIRKHPLLTHAESDDLYRLLWKKNIERLLKENKLYKPIGDLNLDKIALYLKPERDLLVNWQGVQILKNGGCLWRIPDNYFWKTNLFRDLHTENRAVEPIQWVWMRLALSVSLLEKNPEEYIKKYYDLFSQLIILPSESMLRQAGSKAPDYLEDMATRLEDRFETIYESINTAAIGTKWTGTVSIDWSKVRAVGSPVNEGVRHSKGIMQFAKMMNEAMVAQNRTGEDKPITISLPVWHKEILKFIKEKENILPRLKGVINISDLFMQRLFKNEDWILFDPAFFPDVYRSNAHYLEAEKDFDLKKKQHPQSIYKIKALKLWNRILKGLKEGRYTIVFEDSNEAFDILPDLAPSVTGLDGVGSFPLPLSNSERKSLPWVSWPSAAVNLVHCIKNNGEPDLEKLSDYVYLALRLLDNALTITANKEDKETLIYRSVCLGNVGFNEALNEILYNKEKFSYDENITEKWISGLSEAWGLAVLTADQALAKERGVAPVFEKALPYTRFYNPSESLELLKKKRQGNLNVSLDKNEIWEKITTTIKGKGYRFVNRSCWAPFQNIAVIGGVSQGGVGTVYPVNTVEDERGNERWVPNPGLLRRCVKDPDNISKWSLCLKHPTLPRMWEENIRKQAKPDAETWRSMLDMAKRVRPWNDQGVALTLPVGMSLDQINLLMTEAWWGGLNVVRFEKQIDDNERDKMLIIDDMDDLLDSED